MAQIQRKVIALSALSYSVISIFLAGLFFIIASSNGEYNVTARYGGAAWVFLLSMIVTMPLITSFFKKKFNKY